MADFLDAAHRVLDDAECPLSAADITERAIARGWLSTDGKTPDQTMKARLSGEILSNGASSQFMRTGRGLFGLRQWSGRFPEYFAERFAKHPLDEDAVVFDARSLPKYLNGRGLHSAPAGWGTDLLAECRPMPRTAAEEDFGVVQLVSVFVLRHAERYLSYKRSARLPESRLRGERSVYFGGHINPADLAQPGVSSGFEQALFNVFDPEVGHLFLRRELQEEITIEHDDHFVYLGLLFDDSRPVSRQHLGIAYGVDLRSPKYEIGERGFLIDPRFESLAEIDGRVDEFENWSRIILDVLRAGHVW